MNALLGALLAQAPALNPQDPPGWDKVETIINWAAKLTIAACFAGFLITAATMAVQHRRGTLGPEAMGQFGVVLFACVLIGSASGIVNKLV